MRTSLSEGSIAHALFRMALPMTLGICAVMSFNIVDTYFVSGLGEYALAALSFTFPVVMVCVSFSIGLSAGASSAVAIAAGRQDDQAVKELITDSISFACISTIALGIVGLLTINPLFKLLGAEDHLLPHISDYMVIWYIGGVFQVAPMVALAAMRALGSTQLQGSMMIGTAVANALLDPILIFGWWVFPRLEIQGAALASVIVRIISVIILYYFLRHKKDLLINPFNGKRFIASCKKILHVGIPAMGTNMIIPLSGAIVLAIIAHHGVDAVAGYGVAVRIEALSLIFFYALSAVIGPFCGQNLGAKKFDRILKAQHMCAIFSLAAGLLVWGVLAISGGWFASFFSDNPAVIDVTSHYLMIVPVSYFAYGTVMVVNASFNGLSKPLPGVVISSARVIFILLPVMWIGSELWGLWGVFAAIAFTNFFVGVAAYIWIQRTIRGLKKNHHEKTSEEGQVAISS